MKPSFNYAAATGGLLTSAEVTSTDTLLQYARQQLGIYVPVGRGPRLGLQRSLIKEMEYQGWSIADAVASVKWCKRKGFHPSDIWDVLWHIKEVERAPRHDPSNLQTKVAEALHAESDPLWRRRLSLAKGMALLAVYEEWTRVRASV